MRFRQDCAPSGQGLEARGATKADDTASIAPEREVAQGFTPLQRRALFLRRCGCSWWVIHLIVASNRLFPNQPLDPWLQKFLARSLREATQ